MTRLDELFASTRAEGRAALVGYLPVGFPSYEQSVAAMVAMVESGVDFVEVGVPYTDPGIDGPVIQVAVDAALRAGTKVAQVFDAVRAVSAHAPAVIMGYWNPIERLTPKVFAQRLKDAGGSGAITPDLIPEEAGPWLEAAKEHDLDPIFLVAPSSTDERLEVVGRTNRGFVYAASTMGVTGTRDTVSNRAEELVARTRQHTDLPVAVGLGVSNGAQAAEVAGYADAVIVGSAFVRALQDGGLDAVRRLAADLSEGVRRKA
ncbi:MAG: tryptophan synthase alpha chain [Frankiales bacterium]|jgi:tryptophan synthase alpha chain|nr:tryptophan synthase, alpha subunit [Frankiales bacterium]MDX6219860.1 tryptophan synthase alpha chain [Frankiales bacterium]MDX6266478.1 tryptophan synthase alpha chain [Frankiales bacterium]